jgi:ATP-dependent Lhr-like helicase
MPIPASVLERDVLPARIPGYQPRLLDELGSLGEVAWVGRGSLGRDDGRIVLVRPGRELLRPVGQPDGPPPPVGPRHDAIRAHLGSRGASFYRELFAAAGGGSDRDVLTPCGPGGAARSPTHAPPAAACAGSGPERAAASDPRGRRLTALGPPEAAGRWSLVEPPTASATERLHAQALALLERHGVVTREAVVAEGLDGGFSAVYPILRAFEEAGRIRRGYFIDGLGAAQFALAGALDRLRSVREPADPPASGTVHLIAAADPANPYGAALVWPRRGETDRRPSSGRPGPTSSGRRIAAVVSRTWRLDLQTLPAADDPTSPGRPSAARRAGRGWSPRELGPQGRRRGRVGVTVPPEPAGRGLRRRLSGPRPARIPVIGSRA